MLNCIALQIRVNHILVLSKSYIGIKFTDAYNGSKFYCQNVYCSSTNNVQFYDVKVALTNVKKLNY